MNDCNTRDCYCGVSLIITHLGCCFCFSFTGVMHVCDRARGDCKRSPACTVYGDSNTTASLRINMLARQNDTDFCGVYINDVSFTRLPIFLVLFCCLACWPAQ